MRSGVVIHALIAATLLLSGACICASAAELEGKWKSNWELTSAHITATCKTTDKQFAALQSMMGLMTVVHEDGLVTFESPAYEMATEDGPLQMDAWSSTKECRVLHKTDSQIAVMIEDDTLGPQLTILQFVDDDTYWVYVPHGAIDTHIREYFSRIEFDGKPKIVDYAHDPTALKNSNNAYRQ
jgi:hypothetical protein